MESDVKINSAERSERTARATKREYDSQSRMADRYLSRIVTALFECAHIATVARCVACAG